jgi:hypothetical protein
MTRRGVGYGELQGRTPVGLQNARRVAPLDYARGLAGARREEEGAA